MPGHGDHWRAVYGETFDIESIIARDCEDSRLIDSHDCVDVANDSERAEEVACLRWGDGALVEDMLIVTDSAREERFLFSGYPVIQDGIRHRAVVDRVEPWEYGIEGWLHLRVTGEEVPLTLFDTRYYTGSAALQPGQRIEVALAGLAYVLTPLQQTTIEIDSGPFWEMQKQQRLDEGASVLEACKPVVLHLTGMSAFLPRHGECCDEAEFHGVIQDVRAFDHGGFRIYRLDIVVMRPGDEEFVLPVFASERILDGYVPRLGEDVQGIMWVQGQVVRTDVPADALPEENGRMDRPE